MRELCLIKLPPIYDEYLSPYLCGCRKDSNTQTALSSLIKICKQIIDNKGHGAATLMDLFEAIDTINLELLIAKLHAYGFTRESLLIILSYLSDSCQHVKIDCSFSSWSKLTQGVPQGSALRPFIFYALKDIEVCNFADDTTLSLVVLISIPL